MSSLRKRALMFSVDPATMATTPLSYPGNAVLFRGAGSSTAAPSPSEPV